MADLTDSACPASALEAACDSPASFAVGEHRNQVLLVIEDCGSFSGWKGQGSDGNSMSLADAQSDFWAHLQRWQMSHCRWQWRQDGAGELIQTDCLGNLIPTHTQPTQRGQVRTDSQRLS